MNRSFQPNDDGGLSRRASQNPAETAAELLRRFHDIHTLTSPDEVIAHYQTTHTLWRQCVEQIEQFKKKNADIQQSAYDRLPMQLLASALTENDKVNLLLNNEQVECLERQADLLREMRKACVTRMLSLCLAETAKSRRLLYRKFRGVLKNTWPMGEQMEGEHILKQVPLWLYRGSWS